MPSVAGETGGRKRSGAECFPRRSTATHQRRSGRDSREPRLTTILKLAEGIGVGPGEFTDRLWKNWVAQPLALSGSTAVRTIRPLSPLARQRTERKPAGLRRTSRGSTPISCWRALTPGPLLREGRQFGDDVREFGRVHVARMGDSKKWLEVALPAETAATIRRCSAR
jgi:hypothetical protein